MKRDISNIFKDDNSVTVYQTARNPEIVYKEYRYSSDYVETIEELKLKRKKLLAMKKRKKWPEFLIKPITVEPFRKISFTCSFPFIEGCVLDNYLSRKNIDIHVLANFIKDLEESIYKETDLVFPDLANSGNIIILPGEQNKKMNYKIIDPDDIQFDNFTNTYISSMICPSFTDENEVWGMKKCKDEPWYNKNLDIRSIYAIMYYMINNEEFFFPIYRERQNLREYEEILKLINIPENSDLYINSMKILEENVPNEGIGNSLFDLINNGYELETYGKDSFGFKHRLIKR